MDLNKYTELATRTESQLDQIVANPQLIVNLLAMFSAAGRMLDQLKKHTFYGKEYDIDKFNGDYQLFINILQHLAVTKVVGTPEEIGEVPVPELDPRIFHAVIGIATEATEMCEALYDVMMGKEVDLVNLLEESFDVDWYQFILMDATNGDLIKCWETGFEKLKKRYPEKFDSSLAINRDTDAEREILDKGFKP